MLQRELLVSHFLQVFSDLLQHLFLQGAQQEAARLAVQAQQALAHSGLTDTRVLQSLANWVLHRKH